MADRGLIVNFAPTGALADNAKNSFVPITLERIVEDVAAAARVGASIAHLHVRNKDGSPSSDPAKFSALFSALRRHSDCRNLIVCASTSGRHGQTQEERAAVLNLPADIRPEMASLTLGSLNFQNGVSVNTPDTIRYLALRMREQQIKPEIEIFDLGMIEFAKKLIDEGLLLAPYYFNIILGNVAGLQANLDQLGFALSQLPSESIACVGGIGRSQFQANALGTIAADGIRVGLEDNIWAEWTPNKVPASNSGLIEQSLRVALVLRRALATPLEVRNRLGLSSVGS